MLEKITNPGSYNPGTGNYNQFWNYEFTVDDPTTWTAPWTAMPLKLKDEMIFEYGCHEGNEAVPDMLRGHRMEEREAAAKSPTNR